MFDSYVLRTGGPSYVSQNTEIHEHKAPTDESIKILNEMQEKARKDLLASVKVENNIFSCVITLFQQEIMTNSHVFMVKFNLNGNEYFMEDRVSNTEIRRNPIEHVMRKIFEKVAEEITKKLFNDFSKTNDFSKMMNIFGRGGLHSNGEAPYRGEIL